VMFPGAQFKDPELAWKFEVAPGGIGFLEGRKLGSGYRGDLFMAGARDLLQGGHLFRIELSGDRRSVAPSDPRLDDATSASAPTCRPAPTVTCTWCRSRRARSTRSPRATADPGDHRPGDLCVRRQSWGWLRCAVKPGRPPVVRLRTSRWVMYSS
jgi:hypothetical protein